MRAAFTLIELLVVITIIVVLLALLTPALDQAIYQAELAVCGANLKGIATGASTYAMDHRRIYPHRPGTDDPNIDYYPMQIVLDAAYDLRPSIEPYINVRHMLLCPLVPKVDMTVPASGTYIYSPYNLWIGWRYAGAPGMLRLGDQWAGYPGDNVRFSLLAGDRDRHGTTGRAIYGTHPDRLGFGAELMYTEVSRNEPILEIAGGLVQSRWRSREGIVDRGPIDMNQAAADGAVTRFTELKKNDPRMSPVPDNARNNRAGWFNNIPR